MRIVIIEDEQANVSRLKKILRQIDSTIEVVAVLETVYESVIWFESNAMPDLVLMDIRIGDGLSFDIFVKVNLTCPVIFTTAYDEYAARAFKVNGLDYLLKPIEKEDLEYALAKVNKWQERWGINDIVQQIYSLIIKNRPIYRSRFMIPVRDGYRSVSVTDVDFFYHANTITYIVMVDGNQLPLNLSMEELEEQLNPNDFFRVNRQYIIHVNSISMLLNSAGSKLKIVLKRDPKREILASRDRAPMLKMWLNK